LSGPFYGESNDWLRFLTAGSVDDGKSTLIGRLLYDSGGVYEDQLTSISKFSKSQNRPLDLSLITDGLKAEREQGITIDVAYRYFSTPRRNFIIADTPGHEQYTRNMATGSSTAELALLLVDARLGILPQTKRHAYIASLLGIKKFIVAMNKMDLVGYSANTYDRLCNDFQQFSAPLNLEEVRFIPLNALEGDNVVRKSSRMEWYQGPPLLEILETISTTLRQDVQDLRFPIQNVIRSGNGDRGYAGQIARGTLVPGQEVIALPSMRRTQIAEIALHTRDLDSASAPLSVTVTLTDHLDLGRGDMLVSPQALPSISRLFQATLIWISDRPLRMAVPYFVKHTSQTVCGTVLRLQHAVDVHTLEPMESESLGPNEIGVVEIETHKPLFCDSYESNRSTGGFLVIDPMNNETVAAGMINQALPEIGLEAPESDRITARVSGDRNGLTVWFTGLSGSGKTTISNAVCTELLARGLRLEVLDGDIVREHLSRELGFSKADRDENIRRIGFVAKLLTRNRTIVLVAAISPYKNVRDEVRRQIGRFLEVHVSAPLEICELRDPKGLYKKARAGQLSGFTGIDDPYEPPSSPEVLCCTDKETLKECADKVVAAVLGALAERSART
jgi:bifunctional enzyme CysN/CysC